MVSCYLCVFSFYDLCVCLRFFFWIVGFGWGGFDVSCLGVV